MEKSVLRMHLKYRFYIIVSLEAFVVCVLCICAFVISKNDYALSEIIKELVSFYKCFIIALCIFAGITIVLELIACIRCFCKYSKNNVKG